MNHTTPLVNSFQEHKNAIPMFQAPAFSGLYKSQSCVRKLLLQAQKYKFSMLAKTAFA
jgi:hypothetical protein